ncbi:MAG: ACT domain-containing protein [Verrucomicrobiota bacterium]
MTRERLYIVHGMGSDAVGLVGRIATAIAEAGGNIVDLRQDVLHGLFTLYMVVDLSGSDLRIEGLQSIVNVLAEDTGLKFSVDKYVPVARSPEKKNILVIVLGPDRPGIIASVCKTLGQYKSNIEFSQTIAREGIFLMELLTDVSHCTLPLENLKAAVREHASAMGVSAVFQAEDVFNKKKRIILFDLASSFIPEATRSEIIKQTGLRPKDLAGYSPDNAPGSLEKAAGCLEGFPAEVMNSVIEGVTVTPGTMELLQTLKIMGYRIALASSGFSLFTDALRRKLDIEHAFGVRLPVDDDSRMISGGLPAGAHLDRELDAVLARLMREESVSKDDITVISDRGAAEPPGIRLQFDLGQLLDFFNKRIVSKENMVGLLGSFGIPKL